MARSRAWPARATGIATLTYIAEDSVSYEDTNGARGLLRAGGVEWMRAGHGV
jgi:redox-sensitive bicupin YhaK (pirin superfamily)